MKANPEQALREHLLFLLKDGGAHAKFDEVMKSFPPSVRGKKVEKFPHTAWMLLEHMRIAQWDILEFSRNHKHVSPKWPEGYWPKTEAPANAEAWTKSVQSFRKNLKEMETLVSDPKTDLCAPLQWGDGQTVLREALLVADHNAYHLGQLVTLSRLLGAWKD